MQKPSAILIFDVDGVLTDPTQKRVTQDSLFEEIGLALQKGLPVALNTGRSVEWVIERFITPLRARIIDVELMRAFFAVGEKGLTWASINEEGKLIQGVFDKEGNVVEGFDLSVFLTKETASHFIRLEAEVRELIDCKYEHSTFYDPTKKAMISTEMHDGYDQASFASEQEGFVEELTKLLEKEGLQTNFRIDPTTIATDIQLPHAGKHLGAKRILDWLNSRQVSPHHFATIGDSSSDLEMADELHEQGMSVDFWYVNPKKPLSVEKPYPIHTTQNEYEKGTLEALNKILK